MFARGISLFLALLAFWLLNSGHYNALLLTLGVVSALLITIFTARLGTLDEEGHPIGFLPRAVTYWPWLVWEIVKSAIAVTRQILSPHLRITPTMVRIDASQRSTTGFTTYANSITLTPGTISTTVSAEKQTILVHALTREGAKDLAEGGMNRRVDRFEGSR